MIKYGGAAMTDPALRDQVADDIVLMKLVGVNPVVVHGGGPEITGFMDRLGMPVEFYDGLRVTTPEAMEIVKMVLVGKVNKDLVSAINSHGRYAVGLSGEDGNMVQATARDVRLGRVGDVTDIDTTVLDNLIEDGFIPVVATVAAGDDGGSFNVNADIVAGRLAAALSADKCIFLTDVDGLYRDFSDKSSLISVLTPAQAEEMIVWRPARGRHGPQGRRMSPRRARRRASRSHPERNGPSRPPSRGLHRRGCGHDDRGGPRGRGGGRLMGEQLDLVRWHDSTCTMQTYARKPVLFVRGEGMRLYDDEGAEYLDFVSGIGAVNLGHAHPAVTAAIAEQARQARAREQPLLRGAPRGARVRTRTADGRRHAGLLRQLGCGGQRGCHQARPQVGRPSQARRLRVVSALRSFHGRTLATLAATGQPAKQQAFAPLPEGFVHVPLNDIAALDDAVDESVAAVLLEVVQGEGGVWPASAEYLLAAERLCRERDALLIIDEVQTGCFRTGPAFAHQAFGITPDVVTVAKALANGLPIGALIAVDSVAAAFELGDHGSTFGGGPVVCAAGRATLAALESERLGSNSVAHGRVPPRGGLAALGSRAPA